MVKHYAPNRGFSGSCIGILKRPTLVATVTKILEFDTKLAII